MRAETAGRKPVTKSIILPAASRDFQCTAEKQENSENITRKKASQNSSPTEIIQKILDFKHT